MFTIFSPSVLGICTPKQLLGLTHPSSLPREIDEGWAKGPSRASHVSPGPVRWMGAVPVIQMKEMYVPLSAREKPGMYSHYNMHLCIYIIYFIYQI